MLLHGRDDSFLETYNLATEQRFPFFLIASEPSQIRDERFVLETSNLATEQLFTSEPSEILPTQKTRTHTDRPPTRHMSYTKYQAGGGIHDRW